MANRTYRYFKGKPLYAFGDGLSYTTVTYSGLRASSAVLKAGDTLIVQAEVRNAGSLPGDEVSELYLIPPRSNLAPRLALVGFMRFHLNPGETRRLTFNLDPRTLSQVDEKGVRAVIPGNYKLSLGGSQPGGDAGSTAQSAPFTITGTLTLPQ